MLKRKNEIVRLSKAARDFNVGIIPLWSFPQVRVQIEAAEYQAAPGGI
jgi:hypothetical protein